MVPDYTVQKVARTQGAMYKAATKSVILYGREIWVVTGKMLKVMKGLHHQAAQWITCMTENRGAGRECEYPLVVEEMEAAGIHPIGMYIMRRQATIAERVYCRPIYKIFTEAERMPGTSRLVKWWEQDAVNEL